MGSSPSKSGLSAGSTTLEKRMRADWDERIRHDYRYWMSDGVSSDADMWATGERDLELLFGERPPTAKVALEIGCGVGRLLKAAAHRFDTVIGIDVSAVAVEKARSFLKEQSHVNILLGNGLNFDCVQNESVDLVYTFAALSSMPVRVIASYLAETARILRVGGEVRLQVYLGFEQDTVEEDSIAIRSFDRQKFYSVLEQLGFSQVKEWELKLPFEVSDAESGLTAVVISACKQQASTRTTSQVLEALVGKKEANANPNWAGSKVEYWMALNRARTAMEARDLERAKLALEFAIAHYQDPEPEVISLLEEIKRDLGTNTKVEVASASSNSPNVDLALSSNWSRNFQLLNTRFPDLARQLVAPNEWSRKCGDYHCAQTPEGNAIVMRGDFAFDQPQKPKRAAEVWAERALHNPRARQASRAIIAGFGSGYHIEALLSGIAHSQLKQQIYVFEPDLATLAVAMGTHDLTSVISQVSAIFTTPRDLKRQLEIDGGRSNTENEEVYLHIHPQSQALMRHSVDEVKAIISQLHGISSLSPSIAVVGPLYGGSLPIARYTASALEKLGQRVYYYDLSRFYGSYKSVEEMIRNRDKINSLQSYYVEMVSQVVLEGVTERPVDILICLAQAPLSARVLTELRKRGVVTAMWFVEDCRRFLTWKQISPYFDYMFLIQNGEYLKMVEAAGAGKAVYLPVGCDPDVHAPMTLAPEERARWGSQVSFLGAGFNNRVQMFAGLARRDFKIWGTEWPTMAPFDRMVQEGGRRIDPSDYVKIFNSSAINLNLHSSMERDGIEPNGDFVNPRTFELAACGAFQLTDNRALLPDLFESGRDIATFSSPKEMEDGIDYYLARPEERTAMADRARERALREHTYVKRLEAMLGVIYADRFNELKARAESGPWPKALQRSKSHSELYDRYRKVYARGMDPKLEELVADIQTGKGKLTRTEHELLFLHHVKGQISYVQKLRAGE